ncbi:protein ECERIFERUM 16 [Humulus lupulus]|uniref:protein ECERIFERUM 16 n=1 Tax=Humulus lupulus TaxID=3486 RepID=UPI002B4141F4|nr:protein ECERIFERUM 16 [Humulus lupulus]
MDAKSLAKSKRAHSQQHSKKHHPNQKLKAPSAHPNQKLKAPSADTGGAATKPSQKQVKEKTLQSKAASALPSNWDRYDEENDSGPEDPSKKNPDVVLPKSKGADYQHLIAEAESQSQSTLYSDSFLSVDDVLAGEFSQAVGSLLSVKGEGILAWSGDDNFIVEHKSMMHHEASFISLNLHNLAEQLAKIDLSQRLFIEADLLPPELRAAEISEASSTQECDQIPAINDSSAVKEISEDLIDSLVNVEIADPTAEVKSSGNVVHPHTSLSLGVSDSVKQVDVAKYNHRSKVPEFTAGHTVNSFAEPSKKLPEFKVAVVEAELDMLLDSLNVEILDSTRFSSAGAHPMEASSAVEFQLPKKNLDDDLDDLLNQTSSLTNQNNLFEFQGKKSDHFIQSNLSQSRSGTKSEALDDFDAWMDTI